MSELYKLFVRLFAYNFFVFCLKRTALVSCLSDKNIFAFRCVGGEREHFFDFIFKNFDKKWNKKNSPDTLSVKLFVREVKRLTNNILKYKIVETIGKKVSK